MEKYFRYRKLLQEKNFKNLKKKKIDILGIFKEKNSSKFLSHQTRNILI